MSITTLVQQRKIVQMSGRVLVKKIIRSRRVSFQGRRPGLRTWSKPRLKVATRGRNLMKTRI